MGLRVKLRRTFTSSKKSPSVPSIAPPPTEPHYTDRQDIEYYKPHEIPKSKYRGNLDPEHQASLAAFSLADAFSTDRRRSSLAPSGTFSPGGTKSRSRAPSRVPSIVPSRRPSSDWASGGVGAESEDSSSREKSVAASTILSGAETGTSNTSLSAAPAEDSSTTKALAPTDSGIDIPNLCLPKTDTVHDNGEPFTLAELEQAMERATLKTRDFATEVEAS